MRDIIKAEKDLKKALSNACDFFGCILNDNYDVDSPNTNNRRLNVLKTYKNTLYPFCIENGTQEYFDYVAKCLDDTAYCIKQIKNKNFDAEKTDCYYFDSGSSVTSRLVYDAYRNTVLLNSIVYPNVLSNADKVKKIIEIISNNFYDLYSIDDFAANSNNKDYSLKVLEAIVLLEFLYDNLSDFDNTEKINGEEVETPLSNALNCEYDEFEDAVCDLMNTFNSYFYGLSKSATTYFEDYFSNDSNVYNGTVN